MTRTIERRRRDALPAEVESTRRCIERWRATRETRTRMPEELWEAAAAVAREHGLWAVSRALRVNYESLKQRVGRTTIRDEAASAGFVELSGAHLVGRAAASRTILELSSPDGAKLHLQLEGHDALDVVALVAAFRGCDR